MWLQISFLDFLETEETFVLANVYSKQSEVAAAAGAADKMGAKIALANVISLERLKNDRFLHHPGDRDDKSPTHTLEDVLDLTFECECTGPKDDVYAVLGLCSFPNSCIMPDYVKSPGDVLHEATMVMIKDAESLDPICKWHLC